MNSKEFSKGDIIEAKNRAIGKHYIIYFSERSESDFIGGMITTSGIKDNKKMRKDHFLGKDEKGKPYKVRYRGSYLVNAKLIKFESWGKFRLVGRLSHKGILFLEETFRGLVEESFDDYRER